MINGVTQIVMTKADILDGLDELKVSNNYNVNGVETNKVPFQMHKAKIEAIYKTFEGWKTDITKVNSYKNMPPQMNTYIGYINDYLKVPVTYISNGPGREQLVKV